ncbi:hypothetical protein BU14_0266s0023 [Porphyra umbilicalis]|uniref:Uncharacterized protein n=1 Tax=Porphyra umbilicalis TaxID=2786 RepID=A0A1X6P1T9_PORUM|nr:hypothetical protein BU14_0266s0023 [Porphyra umbilicalis]|eukprot:OSX74834.1 hypothetical protein BU14_0266s0023 [Porphyra umbilicalis]
MKRMRQHSNRRCNSVGLRIIPEQSVVLITPKSRVRDCLMKPPSPLLRCPFSFLAVYLCSRR